MPPTTTIITSSRNHFDIKLICFRFQYGIIFILIRYINDIFSLTNHACVDNLSTIAPSQRFSKHDALQRLRTCINEDRYTLHGHFWKRLRERKVGLLDAIHVLRHGIIYAEPEFEPRFGQWRYVVEGNTVDQVKLRVVFTFEEINDVLVLTILN
jgi:hypothetical protein